MEPCESNPKPKFPLSVHLACGWPLLLVLMGGAIGGACGGAAYALSFALFKKKGIHNMTYLWSAVIGIGSIVAYVMVIIALAMAFPSLFKR